MLIIFLQTLFHSMDAGNYRHSNSRSIFHLEWDTLDRRVDEPIPLWYRLFSSGTVKYYKSLLRNSSLWPTCKRSWKHFHEHLDIRWRLPQFSSCFSNGLQRLRIWRLVCYHNTFNFIRRLIVSLLYNVKGLLQHLNIFHPLFSKVRLDLWS